MIFESYSATFFFLGHPAVLVDESSDPVDEVSDLVVDFNPWSPIPRTREAFIDQSSSWSTI
ncbi:hypothetical protein PSY47_23485, partial [Shigella flexneri]|nr:hypothetical protein [Shigella flexneri]